MSRRSSAIPCFSNCQCLKGSACSPHTGVCVPKPGSGMGWWFEDEDPNVENKNKGYKLLAKVRGTIKNSKVKKIKDMLNSDDGSMVNLGLKVVEAIYKQRQRRPKAHAGEFINNLSNYKKYNKFKK